MNLPEAPIAHEGFFATQFFIDLSDLTLQTRSANDEYAFESSITSMICRFHRGSENRRYHLD